jgi:alpha-beta hydrolase superfamily lysophospholipase
MLFLPLLAACAGPRFEDSPTAWRPAGPDAPAARLTNDRLITDDGRALALRTWAPEDAAGNPLPVTAAIVALHGFNDYSNCFAGPAEIWARHGIETFAYDQSGFGASDHPGIWPGGATLIRDLHAAIRLVRARLPGVPLYVLGESMGSTVVLAGLAGTAPEDRPDGAILVAPAVWARSTQPLINRVTLWFAVRTIPHMSFTGEDLGVQASDNIPMLRALGRDPLFIKATRVDAVYGLVDLMDQGLAAAKRFTLPALVLYGAHDQVIPKEPVADLVAALPGIPGGTQRFGYYAHGWHMLLRDREGPWVAEDVAAWIADHESPLPSGADREARNFPPVGQSEEGG